MTHDYADAPERDPELHAALSPTFQEPEPTVAAVLRPVSKAVCAYCEGASHTMETCPTLANQPAPEDPAMLGPVPVLEGAVAIYVTPDQSAVIAFRPRGSSEDRKMVIPAFIIDMACRQAGRTPAELFTQLQEGLDD
ncbi:MAG: hypothetical protein ACJ786_36185 [Catenulispora sp.]